MKIHKRYQVPTRQTIKNLLVKKFDVQRLKICETFVNDIPGKIALTSDIWSSATNKSYLSLTAHFITQEWKLKKILLDIIPMTERHTAPYIAKLLQNILADFKLSKFNNR